MTSKGKPNNTLTIRDPPAQVLLNWSSSLKIKDEFLPWTPIHTARKAHGEYTLRPTGGAERGQDLRTRRQREARHGVGRVEAPKGQVCKEPSASVKNAPDPENTPIPSPSKSCPRATLLEKALCPALCKSMDKRCQNRVATSPYGVS